MKKNANKPVEYPKRLKIGNTEVTIYEQSNPSRRLNADTVQWEATGKVFDEFVLAYYQGVLQEHPFAIFWMRASLHQCRQSY